MTKILKVLVACEESQSVTKEFRALGHEAYSCDLLPCSGGHPEWHFQCDVRESLYHNPIFSSVDLLIAHPPCTYLSNSGVSWLSTKSGINADRFEKMVEAANFFKFLMNLPILHIAIENPIPHKYALEIIGKKYSQIIQPYMFGHAESKATCFWLKNLPKLSETNNVKQEWMALPKNKAQRLHYLPPGPERAKLRSKTFPGIAKAMAQQWSEYLTYDI